MKFIIERYSYFGTAFTLRLPLVPGLPWPYFKHEVGIRGNDDLRPNEDDAEEAAREIITKKWLRYGKDAAVKATFEFKDTEGG